MFLPELAPIRARIAALEQFNRDSRLLVLDPAWWAPIRSACPARDGCNVAGPRRAASGRRQDPLHAASAEAKTSCKMLALPFPRGIRRGRSAGRWFFTQ
jgi:hypothetical protein